MFPRSAVALSRNTVAILSPAVAFELVNITGTVAGNQLPEVSCGPLIAVTRKK
jgi:hypothetical protein